MKKGGQIDGTTKEQLEYMADEGVIYMIGKLTNKGIRKKQRMLGVLCKKHGLKQTVGQF